MVVTGGGGRPGLDYQPGVCNIGPAEIAHRRRAGHVAAVVTVGLFGLLAATHSPRWSRLLIALPAASSAGGYIQARSHFCAGFGSRGVFNFGPLGQVEVVRGAQDRARDAAASRRIAMQSAGVGVAVAAVALALPG